MANDERYNGWKNRETWATALHIDNDQGLWVEAIEKVREAIENNVEYADLSWMEDSDDEDSADWATCGNCGFRWNDANVTSRTPVPAGRCPIEADHLSAYDAGQVIKDWLEEILDPTSEIWQGSEETWVQNVYPMLSDIGSLWRVDWEEIGASILEDIVFEPEDDE